MTKGSSPLNSSTSSSPTPASSTTRTFHYLHPDSLDEVFVKDPKQSPLALLAQACNNIGKELEASTGFNHRQVGSMSEESVRNLPVSFQTYSPPLETTRGSETTSNGKRSFPGSAGHEEIAKRSKKTCRNVTKSSPQASSTFFWNANKSKTSPPVGMFSQETADLGNEKRVKYNILHGQVEEDRLSSSCGRSTVTPDVSPTDFSHPELMKWSSKLSETSASSINANQSGFLEHGIPSSDTFKKENSDLTSSEAISNWMNWLLFQQSASPTNNNNYTANILTMWQKMAAVMPQTTVEMTSAPKSSESLLPSTPSSTVSNNVSPLSQAPQPLYLSGVSNASSKASFESVYYNHLMQMLSPRQHLPTTTSFAMSPVPVTTTTSQDMSSVSVKQSETHDVTTSYALVQYCMYCGRHCPTFQEWILHVQSHGPITPLTQLFTNASLILPNLDPRKDMNSPAKEIFTSSPILPALPPSGLQPLLQQQQQKLQSQALEASSPQKLATSSLSSPFPLSTTWPFPFPHPLASLNLANGLNNLSNFPSIPPIPLATSVSSHSQTIQQSTSIPEPLNPHLFNSSLANAPFSSIDNFMQQPLKIPFLNGVNYSYNGAAINSSSMPAPCFTC